jgi:membrane fusion protein, heavy metal efflux system
MSETRASRPVFSPRVAWAMTVVLLAAAVAFIGLVVSRDPGRAGMVAPAEAAPGSVDAADAVLQTALVTRTAAPVRTRVPGRIAFNANAVTPLFAPFSGRVVGLDGEVGMTVREGDVLAVLDSADVIGLHADYQDALAGERAARASLEQAERARARAERLADADAIPRRELQEAEVAEAHAAEDLRRASGAVAAARGRLQLAGVGDEELALLVDEPARLDRRMPIRAPVDGTVVERNLGLGQLVDPGDDVLFRIADLSTIWVLADVYDDQLQVLRPGAPVTIQVPAYPDDVFSARIDWIGATVDPETRTVAVRAVLPNDDGRLRPGLYATVVLHADTAGAVLSVPISAVVASGADTVVFVARDDGTYEARAIETGRDLDGQVEILDGLDEGERIVIRGSVLLAAGHVSGDGRP